MADFYNLTNTSGGFMNLITGTNNALNSLPMLGILIALYVVLFVGMLPGGLTRSALTSSFITGIIGIMFTLTGLISATWLGVFIILLAVTGGGAIIYSKNQGGDI